MNDDIRRILGTFFTNCGKYFEVGFSKNWRWKMQNSWVKNFFFFKPSEVRIKAFSSWKQHQPDFLAFHWSFSITQCILNPYLQHTIFLYTQNYVSKFSYFLFNFPIFISFCFIHFSRSNSISIILFWENTGSTSKNYQVFEISNHSFYFNMYPYFTSYLTLSYKPYLLPYFILPYHTLCLTLPYYALP